MSFAGGSFAEVERWLWNFLTAHAKRADPRAEVRLVRQDRQAPRGWRAELRLGPALSPPWEFAYAEVAAQRGSLAWCEHLAREVESRVRALGAPALARSGGG